MRQSEEVWELLREWVQAEVEAGIADSQEGSDGFYGTGYAERAEAKRLFEKLKEKLAG